jgi:phage major head subunit gpT-like protein
MLINANSIEIVRQGFRSVFNSAFLDVKTNYKTVSMIVPSSARDETYGWLGNFPEIREWIGERIICNLRAYSFTITNREFESTIKVKRNDIADDRYGLFKPMFTEMGRATAQHPDRLIFSLLASGFENLCYDGQYFFDTDHPVLVNGDEQSISNVQAGDGPGWYLLDTSRGVKPMIWQEREPYQFTSLDGENDENVFMRGEYLYGTRARVNAGFGLWQLAFGSRAPLTKENYEAARAAMMALKADNGNSLGITPTVLVVPTSLEGAGRRVLKATVNGGEANEWAGSADLIVSHFL